jgi:hypothetical protein
MATQKYQVPQNRMISHAGVDYTGGDIVTDIPPKKAKFHIKEKNLVPYSEDVAIALSDAPVELSAELE